MKKLPDEVVIQTVVKRDVHKALTKIAASKHWTLKTFLKVELTRLARRK